MGQRTPEKRERNIEMYSDYQIYKKLKEKDPIEASKMMIKLINKYQVTEGRICQIGNNPKYKK